MSACASGSRRRRSPRPRRSCARYYRRAPAEDLRGREPVDLYGAALSHRTFGRDRAAGETRVRAYNPTFEQHGWQSPHTAIEVVSDDMPFLVDSVGMELSRREAGIHVYVHPVIGAESYMHIEVDRQADGHDELAEAVRGVLAQVRAAVEDWQPMRERMQALVQELGQASPPGVDPAEIEEARALLAWVSDHHFTFLGYREYELVDDELHAVADSGLGLLRGGGGGASTAFAKLPPAVRALALERTPLVLSKANARSTIHRPSYLDYIGVKRFDADGNVVGERRFLGLYTTAAYREVPASIPVLRRKAQAVRERAGFPPGSHDDKALVEIIDTYPRDELFQIDADELYETVSAIRELGERQRVRLFMRTDRYERFVSCLVFLPRDRFNTANRLKIGEILRAALGAETVDWELRLTEWVLVRIQFTLRVPAGELPDYDAAALEAQIIDATRSWDDDLQAALVEEMGEEAGTVLFRRYGSAFPAAYREDLLARSAVADVQRLEALEGDDALDLSLYRPLEAPPGALRCKLYRRGARVSLSDVLPMFESLGLTVSDERPYLVTPRDAPPAWIYDFGLQAAGDVDCDAIRDRFHEGFVRVWRGEAELDGFNGLIIAAGLDWREVTMLRSLARYLRQAGIPFSDRYMEETLLGHADVAAALVALFHARFDPAGDRTRAEACVAEIEAAIDAVDSLDEDRILRGFLSVLRAMLRTNYYLAGPEAVRVVQARPDADPARAAAEAALRDLRALAAGGGRAPARRLGRPRRPALVGPAGGLPHRDPRPDEGADGQERADRARGREGRLRGQARRRRGRRVLHDVHQRAAGHHGHDLGREGRAAGARHPPRRRRPVPRGGRRQGHRDVLGHRQRRRAGVRLLARRRVRLRRLGRLRPQGDGDHGAVAWVSVQRHFREARGSTSRPRTSRWPASAT